MLALQGYWYNGKTSVRVNAELQVNGDGYLRVITCDNKELLCECAFSSVRISSRIGGTPRYLYFAQGEKFETLNNECVDQLLHLHRPSLFNTLAHQLESHLYFVLCTVAVVVALSWSGVKYGLPAVSKIIAYRLPQNVMTLASTETITLLDKTHLKPSKLESNVQMRVLESFESAVQENSEQNIKILFRDGGDLGANAFALPDGTVIFTDEMVQLAKNDDELIAVLAHEIGHVKYRHGLRAAIQSSSIGFFVSMLTGDLSAVSSVLTAIPIVLTTLSYSRDFEREADQHALAFLDAHNIPRISFVNLMERVTYESHCDMLLLFAVTDEKMKTKGEDKSALKIEKETEVKAEAVSIEPPKNTRALTETEQAARKQQCDSLMLKHKADENNLMDYFSTHPATGERLQQFKQSRS